MTKLTRNVSDPESAEFWRHVDKVAAAMRAAPAWMKAGIVLDPRHYETYPPQPELEELPPRDRK
jgi:hypothetical protein